MAAKLSVQCTKLRVTHLCFQVFAQDIALKPLPKKQMMLKFNNKSTFRTICMIWILGCSVQ